jgi:hypothetical protein
MRPDLLSDDGFFTRCGGDVKEFMRMTAASRRTLSALAWLFAASAISAESPAPDIDPQVRSEVGEQGSARVLVDMRLAKSFTPEGKLPDQGAIEAQQRAIAAAQQSVINRLSGTRFKMLYRSSTTPLLGLEVAADALARLEESGEVVARVSYDAAHAPTKAGAKQPR